MKPFDVILLDLDGTLTDSAPGILACIRHAYEKLGLIAPPRQELLLWMGPPLLKSFMEVAGLTEEKARMGVAYYRDRFDTVGWQENSVYDGVFEMLTALKEAGYRLVLATAKPTYFARRIVLHFGLMPYLEDVFGVDLDGPIQDKSDVIGHILNELQISPHRAVMVGDRNEDLLSAASYGVAGIGCAWGYAAEGELLACQPLNIASSPQQVSQYLLEE